MMIDDADHNSYDYESCDSDSEYITPLIMFGVITYAYMKAFIIR